MEKKNAWLSYTEEDNISEKQAPFLKRGLFRVFDDRICAYFYNCPADN